MTRNQRFDCTNVTLLALLSRAVKIGVPKQLMMFVMNSGTCDDCGLVKKKSDHFNPQCQQKVW